MKYQFSRFQMLIILLFFGVISYAQTLTQKEGKFYHSNGYEFEKSQLEIVYKDHPEATYLLNDHIVKADRAKMLSVVSGLSFVGVVIAQSTKKDPQGALLANIGNTWFTIAFSTIGTFTGLAAIGNFNKSKKRLKESINAYSERNNLSLPEQNTSTLELGLKGPGIGLNYTF